MPRKLWLHNGSYYLRLRKREGGKEVVKYRNLGRDKYAAIDRARPLEDVPDLGGHPDMDAFAKLWLKEYVAGRRNEQGQKLAKQRMNDHVLPALGKLLVAEVRSPDLRRLRVRLDGSKLSPQSVLHVLADVRCLLLYAAEAGVIQRSPWVRGLLPRLQQRPPDRLTTEEMKKVLGIPEPYAWVARLALDTMLRWGELARARADHLRGDLLEVAHTKSGRIRRVPVGPAVAGEIRGRVGRLVPFSPKSLDSVTRIIRDRSGVERFHMHQFRHTGASRFIEAGGSLAALQEILGHSSIVTTQRYARLAEDVVSREAARVGGYQRGYQAPGDERLALDKVTASM